MESSLNILEQLGRIEDPRKEINRLHQLDEILFIALCSTLAGGEGFDEMEEFGRLKEQWLRQFLKLENGIASHDTFSRVFNRIDPEQFIDALVQWTQAIRDQIAGEVVAIDGKSLRRTGKTKENMVHVLSAWAVTNRLVLGQVKVEGKSNEITAVPQLLRMLELTGCIVTLDAMGTQKNIAKEISEADADYVLALKGNHQRAYQEVSSFLDDAIKTKESHLEHIETVEKDHGRIETRRVWITENIDWFADRKHWEKLKSFGVVELTRETPSATTTERRYFLCSIAANAQNFAHAVRSHWGVENSLHWVLDVNFNEDQCRIRTGHGAENMALLRKFALNLIRQDSSHRKKSVQARQKAASWSQDYLLTLLKSKT